MLDPYSLLIGALSLLVAAGYFGIDVGPVLLHPISVPATLEQGGYGGSSFSRLVLSEIEHLHFVAGADYVGASVQVLSDDAKVSIAGADISLSELNVVLARKLGTIRCEFSGAIVERDGKLVLMLTGKRVTGERYDFTETAGPDDPYRLVQAAAKDIVGVADPYAAMKLQFEADKVAGDFSSSLSMIRDLFARMPAARFHYLYNLAGRALDLSGRPEQAIAAYQKALTYDPNYAITYSNLALTLRGVGRTEEADRFDRAALERDPHFVEFFRYWADAYRRAGYWDRCVYNFSRFLHYVQNDARAYYDLGSCLRQLGRSAESRGALDRAAALDPAFGSLPLP